MCTFENFERTLLLSADYQRNLFPQLFDLTWKPTKQVQPILALLQDDLKNYKWILSATVFLKKGQILQIDVASPTHALWPMRLF